MDSGSADIRSSLSPPSDPRHYLGPNGLSSGSAHFMATLALHLWLRIHEAQRKSIKLPFQRCTGLLSPEDAELHCWKKVVGSRGRAASGQSRDSGLIVYSWHLMLGSSPVKGPSM